MKKFGKWFIGGVIILAVLMTLFVSSNKKTDNQKVVKIGFIAPQTGDAASYGEYATKAFKLAVDDFNSEHSNLRFEVIYEDGKCSASESVSAINKLKNIDEVQYSIGGFCSSETLGMAPIAEDNKMILFTPGSGSPDITNAGDYIFRNLASDDYTAKEIAQIAIENSNNQIAIISENTDYPQALRNAFKEYYKNKGGEVLIDETFNSGSTDFRTIITKAKSANVKSVYLVVQSYKTSAPLLKQMTELLFRPTIYTTEATISSEALSSYDNNVKALLEGAIFTQPRFDESNTKTANILSRFADRYGTIEGPIPPVYIATYYDSVWLLGEAILNNGNSPDQVKDYFYKVKNWQGAVGNFSFDSNGDAITDVEAKTVQNGEITNR